MERIGMALLFPILLTKCNMTNENNCTGESLCRLDFQRCLNYVTAYDPTPCIGLEYSPVYIGSKEVTFTAWSRSNRNFKNGTYTISIYFQGIFEHVEGCCDIPFGEQCVFPWEGIEGYRSAHATLEDGSGYCYQRIFAEQPKHRATEWCCDDIDLMGQDVNCTDEYPCMGLEKEKIILKTENMLLSWDIQSTAEYCFFEAPNSYAEQEKSDTHVTSKGFVFGVRGITINATEDKVVFDGRSRRCDIRELKSMDPVEFTSDLKWQTGYTWCFFVRSDGFSEWNGMPICLKPCDECVAPITNVVVAVAVALSSALMMLLAAVFCACLKKWKILFPDKNKSTEEIPECTREIFRESEINIPMVEKEIPDLMFIFKDKKDRTTQTTDGIEKRSSNQKNRMIEHDGCQKNIIEDCLTKGTQKRPRIESDIDVYPNEPFFDPQTEDGYSSKDIRTDVRFLSGESQFTKEPNADSGTFSMFGDSSGECSINRRRSDNFEPEIPRTLNSSGHSQIVSENGDWKIEMSELHADSLSGASPLSQIREKAITVDTGYIEKNEVSTFLEESLLPVRKTEISDSKHLTYGLNLGRQYSGADSHINVLFESPNAGSRAQQKPKNRNSTSSTDTGCGSNSCDDNDDVEYRPIIDASIKYNHHLPGYVQKPELILNIPDFFPVMRLGNIHRHNFDSNQDYIPK